MAQSWRVKFVSSVGSPVRRGAAGARTVVLRAVLKQQLKWSRPDHVSFPLADLLHLMFPAGFPPGLDLERTVVEITRSLRVGDLATLKKILAAIDASSSASPVQIRFGPGDLERVQMEPDHFFMHLDRTDLSVSLPMLTDRQYEPEVSQFLRDTLQPGMTFVDIGANVGYHTLLGSRLVGPSGRVFAFEPMSENCRTLLISAAENGVDNVTLFPVALGERAGWVHMASHLGSNASEDSNELDRIASGYGTIVPAFSLDDMAVLHGELGGRVDVVKIDVEGAEGRVMRGAEKIIEKQRPIIVSEISEEMLGRVSDTTLRDYLEWFTGRGYTLSVLDRQGGPPSAVTDMESFLGSWGDRFRIENVVLRPD